MADEQIRTDPWFKCAVCGRVVDVITDEPEGRRGPDSEAAIERVVIGYAHTAADRLRGDGDDHTVVPVPANDFAGTPRCDFCSADLRPAYIGSDQTLTPPEGWRLHVGEMTISTDVDDATMIAAGLQPSDRERRHDADWCACDVCADLIRRDKWMLLARRAADATSDFYGYTDTAIRMRAREHLWKVYAGIRKVAGPLEPFYS